MRLMLTIATLFFMNSPALCIAAPNGKALISLVMDSHDASIQLLAKAIESDISSSKVMKVSLANASIYRLTSPNLLIDKLDGREVLVYDVILSYAKKSVHLKGICYKRKINVCSGKIVNRVEAFMTSRILE